MRTRLTMQHLKIALCFTNTLNSISLNFPKLKHVLSSLLIAIVIDNSRSHFSKTQ